MLLLLGLRERVAEALLVSSKRAVVQGNTYFKDNRRRSDRFRCGSSRRRDWLLRNPSVRHADRHLDSTGFAQIKTPRQIKNDKRRFSGIQYEECRVQSFPAWGLIKIRQPKCCFCDIVLKLILLLRYDVIPWVLSFTVIHNSLFALVQHPDSHNHWLACNSVFLNSNSDHDTVLCLR